MTGLPEAPRLPEATGLPEAAGPARDPAAQTTTRIQTEFGEFVIPPADILTFPTGLPGFERCRRFVLLSAEELAPFQCLYAMDGPKASFAVVDPRIVEPS